MLEEPMIKKCCRCVPLRLCLQIWAWLKVVGDLTAALYIFAGLLLFWMTHNDDLITRHKQEYFFIVLLLILIVDVIFVAVLIGGLFKKRYSFLRIFFYYGIYMILAEATLLVVFLVLVFHKTAPTNWDGLGLYCLVVFLIGVLWIAVDIFMIVILKSVMVKIRNKEQYDFARIMNSVPVIEFPRVHVKYAVKNIEEDSRTQNSGEKYSKLLPSY